MDLRSIEVPRDELVNTIDSIREHPSKFVKKRIKHKIFNEQNGSEQWYRKGTC